LGLVLLGSALATALPAAAQGEASDEMARRHFESGVAYLQESDYDNALKAFDKAYELSRRPAILINIATVKERQGDAAGAIAALKEYVELEPTGEHAETAKLRIQNLEKRLAEEQESAPPPEPEPAPPPPPAATPTPPPPAEPPRAEPPPPNRLPAYVALGAGGLMAGGAVITGILAASEYSDLETSCSPNCTDDEVSSTKTLAWVSTGLTVGAGIGIGVGVVLLLVNSPSQTETAGTAPHLDVAVDQNGADARATWRF
jgi:tetratricopeptide (TPR) repeat protein